MDHRVFLAAVVLIFLSGSCSAALLPSRDDWGIAGEWSVYGYHDLDNDGINDKTMSDSRLLLKNQLNWAEHDVVLRADTEWRFQTFHGMDHHSNGELRLRDAYLEVTKDSYDLAIGQKRVTWGKMDDLVILDRVSPQDFTHFILYDKQERKDPALMIQHQWFGWEGFQLETIFLPVFEPSEMDFFGTNWAVFGHLKQAVAESSAYSADQKQIVSGITIQDDRAVTSTSLKNSQAAIRLRGRARDIDYGLYYMNLYHSQPVLKEVNPAGNMTKQFLFEPTVGHLDSLVSAGASGDDLRLIKAHPRVNAAGADWETVAGVFGVRGEVAVFFGMPYLRENFSYVEKDLISFGFGVDHTTENQWYFDAQYIQDYMPSYENLYSVERAPAALAGTVSKDYLRGAVHLSMDWMWQISYEDWMLNPEVTYKWNRADMDISIGSFIFDGRRSKTLFGRFADNDVVYVKLGGKF